MNNFNNFLKLDFSFYYSSSCYYYFYYKNVNLLSFSGGIKTKKKSFMFGNSFCIFQERRGNLLQKFGITESLGTFIE